MLSDTEIAAQAKVAPISEIAARLGVEKSDLIPYGEEIAKVRVDALSRPRPRQEPGKLILVSATTPTSAGEGKTTTSIGLGGRFQGIPREGGFDITAASEIMAILCLANGMEDLRERLDRILIGTTYDGEAIFLDSLGITDAMLALLRDAVHPNLVQTLEGTPVFMHGGPFANIAHGCNSVFATRMAMHFADWAITEAGFGFDLGAEKFFDIKCRSAGLNPDAVVLVTTIRALNRFYADTDEEIRLVQERAERHDVRFAESRHFAEGGAGSTDLARQVMAAAENKTVYKPLYDLDVPVVEKVTAVSQAMYGANDVAFTKEAEKDLKRIEELGLSHLPICVAKAPSSLSDDPALHGRPRDFQVTVRNLQVNSGAGFLVVLTGAIMRMPGLPRQPLAQDVKYHSDGTIEGIG